MTGSDRLFVPLKGEHYRAFEAGEKDIELRGINDQFNPDTVTPGRRVELRRGYSTPDSLWGTIGRPVHIINDYGYIADLLDHQRILPDSPRSVFEYSVEEMLGDYDRWIAFIVDLDDEYVEG